MLMCWHVGSNAFVLHVLLLVDDCMDGFVCVLLVAFYRLALIMDGLPSLYLRPAEELWNGLRLYEASLPDPVTAGTLWIAQVADYSIETSRGTHSMNTRFWMGSRGERKVLRNPPCMAEMACPI